MHRLKGRCRLGCLFVALLWLLLAGCGTVDQMPTNANTGGTDESTAETELTEEDLSQPKKYQVIYNSDSTHIQQNESPYHAGDQNSILTKKMVTSAVMEAIDAGIDCYSLAPGQCWVPWWPSQYKEAHADWYGNEVGKFKYAYLGEIEIWEDTKNVEKTSVESVPADMITAPVAGIAFSRTLKLGEMEGLKSSKVEWTDLEGKSKTKAAAGNTYVATVTLELEIGYAFTADTVIPEEYAAEIQNDGTTLVLKKQFAVEAVEEESSSAQEDVTTAPTVDSTVTTEVDSSEDVGEEKSGCGASVAFGAMGICLISAVAMAIRKKKEK